VPQLASTNDFDAAVQFCQGKCEDAQAFHSFASSGDPPPAGSCSQCTGFFAQRHHNGHEICGFYTLDLNDGDLDKVAHGHALGQLCIKKKVSVSVTMPLSSYTDTEPPGTPLDDNLTLDSITELTTTLGWKICGAQYANVSAGATAGVVDTSFRFDVSEAPDGSTVTTLQAQVDALFPDNSRRLQESPSPSGAVSDFEGRNLAAQSSSQLMEVPSCMTFVCPAGYTDKPAPRVYCCADPCLPEECCSFDAAPDSDVGSGSCGGRDGWKSLTASRKSAGGGGAGGGGAGGGGTGNPSALVSASVQAGRNVLVCLMFVQLGVLAP